VCARLCVRVCSFVPVRVCLCVWALAVDGSVLFMGGQI